MQCSCTSPVTLRSRKAVQAVGQYFDFSSIGEFFSSGFGQTLANLATTVAKTEIVGALSPGPTTSQPAQAPRPVSSVTPIVVTSSPQQPVQSITISPQPVIATPADTYTTPPVSVAPGGLPIQPNIPGALPQNLLTLPAASTPQPAQPWIAGLSNTEVLIIGGLLLLVLLKKVSA